MPTDPAASSLAAQQAAYARGRQAHPALALSFADFLGRRVGAAAPRAAEDFYLARACDCGLPGAWEVLQTSFDTRLRAFLRKRGARDAEAVQLLDEVWGSLAVPPARGGARTSIGTYDGRGALFAWLATIVWRRLTDTWRARAATTTLDEHTFEASASGRDPATRMADDEAARLVAEALEEAWGGLTPRELQAVVMKYRHQLPQTEIARALRVGTPRVTRILQSAASRLRTAIETRFGDQPDWQRPGSGYAALFEALERILARAAVAVDAPPTRRSDHG